MLSDDKLSEIFTNLKVIAVYGMSTNPDKPSHSVPAYFIDEGFTVVPVNPRADEIKGQKSYAALKDIPETIDLLDVFRPSEACLDVVKEALERRKSHGDIDVIWLQEGIVNEEARAIAEEAGITFIQDRCIYKEYIRLK